MHSEVELPMRNVPFFNYQALFKENENEFMDVISDVCSRGAYIMQKDLREFEEAIASYPGIKHAVGVANATDGINMALRASGIRQGDEVIFPSHTFVATAAAIHFAGGVPVPVECGPDHMMDPAAIGPAVTKKTKFIMPVQLNGRTCKMDLIQNIADMHGLTIVEDAAQSLGSLYKGKRAGTFGKASAISFYPAKILGCFGDGGMVVTDDDDVYKKLLLLRDHGRDENGRVVMWGMNSRLDNIQAAILHFQFKYFDKTVARRREIALMYQKGLGGMKELLLPAFPGEKDDHFDSFQNYEIEADRRDELREFLKLNGIGTLIQWGGIPVHQFHELGFAVNLPRTDEIFRRCLMLPMNPFLSDEDADHVISTIRGFYHS